VRSRFRLFVGLPSFPQRLPQGHVLHRLAVTQDSDAVAARRCGNQQGRASAAAVRVELQDGFERFPAAGARGELKTAPDPKYGDLKGELVEFTGVAGASECRV
jgi:hypothetical protein